jgi:hypothetical protein
LKEDFMTALATPQKVLDYIKKSGALVEQAEKQAAAQAQKEAAVAALIPDVVDSLVSNGRIPSELRDKAAEQLKDPVKTLEILASVAAHRTDAELAHLGTPEKSASSRNGKGEDPYVGRISSEPRESDSLLMERILGNR